MVHKTKKKQKGITLTAKEADARSARNIAAAKAKGKRVTTLPTIKLEKKKKKGSARERAFERTRLAAFAKKGTPKERLAVTVGIVPGGGGLKAGATAGKAALGVGRAGIVKAAEAGRLGRITQTVSAHELMKKTGSLAPRGTIQIQKGFTGRPSIPKEIERLFIAVRPTATRFAKNPKSSGLTTKLLIGAGLSLGAAALARDILGTYPFASFGKEEALQVTGFPVARLIAAGELDKAQELLDFSNEIIETVPSKIPYKNVLQEFEKYVEAQAKANEAWQVLIDDAREQAETGKTEFQESQAESRQTKLEERERDAEYFALIREGKFEEADELLQSELKGGN